MKAPILRHDYSPRTTGRIHHRGLEITAHRIGRGSINRIGRKTNRQTKSERRGVWHTPWGWWICNRVATKFACATQILMDSRTEITKVGDLLVRTVRVLLRKYLCEDELHNVETRRVPSYPRKRVSRLIRRKTNLDSRVRGNDASRKRVCGGKSILFHPL